MVCDLSNNANLSFLYYHVGNEFSIPLIYTEQKWKRYTTIIYVLWESIGQKVFNKA